MKKWEYIEMRPSFLEVDQLNKLGEAGWELCANLTYKVLPYVPYGNKGESIPKPVDVYLYIFKREIPYSVGSDLRISDEKRNKVYKFEVGDRVRVDNNVSGNFPGVVSGPIVEIFYAPENAGGYRIYRIEGDSRWYRDDYLIKDEK